MSVFRKSLVLWSLLLLRTLSAEGDEEFLNSLQPNCSPHTSKCESASLKVHSPEDQQLIKQVQDLGAKCIKRDLASCKELIKMAGPIIQKRSKELMELMSDKEIMP